jgi:hypothetical protein
LKGCVATPLTDAYARRKRPVGAGGVQISYRQAVAALSRTPLGPTAVDIVTRALKSVVPERQRRRLR